MSTFHRVRVESITPNKTRTFVEFIDPATYWEVELLTEPHRAWYVIHHDGWHVAELHVREFLDLREARWVGRTYEPIPAEVISLIPAPFIENIPLPSGVY